MNISHHSTQGPDRPDRSKVSKDLRIKSGDLAKPAQEAQSTSGQQRVSQDKIELSASAQAFVSNEAQFAEESPTERAERIEHLKRLAVTSELNTVERAKLSAERLLEGK